MQVEMEAMAIEIPPLARHPNRMPFEGVLTIADEASDRPPSGARGHRVLLPAASVEAALPRQNHRRRRPVPQRFCLGQELSCSQRRFFTVNRRCSSSSS